MQAAPLCGRTTSPRRRPMAKSEYLMEPNVKAVPAKLIPQDGDGHLRLRLVLKLNGLALGGSDVGAEGQ